ncbi:MAG: hypothetical protein V3T53_04190 [Phycisphaerales bacterium]
MKIAQEVSKDKLRGGYYTGEAIVDACYDILSTTIDRRENLAFLEPAAGDGAFVDGLCRAAKRGLFPRARIDCVEVVEEEAAKCQDRLHASRLKGSVSAASFFEWLNDHSGIFDALVGNPPYVRYQFVPDNDRKLAEQALDSRGYGLHGVSNFWIPFVLLSFESLRLGGAFAFVLPSELLATSSAKVVRSTLVKNFEELSLHFFPRGSFRGVLQDIVIVSGRRATHSDAREIRFVEHDKGQVRQWSHRVPATGEAWTRFLLTRKELEAVAIAEQLPGFVRLSSVARIGVAIVTGANDFFTVDDATIQAYKLQRWARPLLARTADSLGICFYKRDHIAARKDGRKAWILDFSADRSNPLRSPSAAYYLQQGEVQDLQSRYKCRIRDPWYRVPHIRTGRILLTKRSHRHPRLLFNSAGVFTTDTIYRGEMLSPHKSRLRDFIAGFHNSLTMLSAELEGRTYGGGVLELVPTEVGRLLVPLLPLGNHLRDLDNISRDAGGQADSTDALVAATDQVLLRSLPNAKPIFETIITARARLMDRRFAR